MDYADLRLDGNAAAGLLSEVFAAEMTSASGTCAGCGATNVFAEAQLYTHAPGHGAPLPELHGRADVHRAPARRRPGRGPVGASADPRAAFEPIHVTDRGERRHEPTDDRLRRNGDRCRTARRGLRRVSSPTAASRSRSSNVSWSAVSAPTGPASRPRRFFAPARRSRAPARRPAPARPSPESSMPRRRSPGATSRSRTTTTPARSDGSRTRASSWSAARRASPVRERSKWPGRPTRRRTSCSPPAPIP